MQTDERKRLIKLIHVAKRELSMSDDTYQQILLQVGGRTSSADMGMQALEAVLRHLKKCGFKVAAPRRAGTRARAAQPQDKLIRHLWLSLHTAGAVRDPSEAALARWVHRETGVEALQWLNGDQASKCIEKLKQWAARLPRSTR